VKNSVVLTNFAVRRLTPEERELAKGLWASGEFLPTDEYWLAEFEIDGLKRQAGIRRGRRADVAEDMDQFDIQLRISQEELDEDVPLIAEAQAADILTIVRAEWEKGEYWNIGPTCPTHKSSLRLLSSPLKTKQGSLVQGEFEVLECAVQGCPVKYSLRIAPDWSGFFKLDENGKPVSLTASA
jgi:hypothetical protein